MTDPMDTGNRFIDWVMRHFEVVLAIIFAVGCIIIAWHGGVR